jgi:hypothetical protein
MKYMRVFMVFVLFAPIAAASLGQEARCPYDGENAQKISEDLISSKDCPGAVNNAARATYSHIHINGALVEKHTFEITECLNR